MIYSQRRLRTSSESRKCLNFAHKLFWIYVSGVCSLPLKCGHGQLQQLRWQRWFVCRHALWLVPYMSHSSHSLVGVREDKNPNRRITIVTLKMFTVHKNIPVLDVLQPGHGVHMIYANWTFLGGRNVRHHSRQLETVTAWRSLPVWVRSFTFIVFKYWLWQNLMN